MRHRLAIKTGAQLVPCYCFGLTDVYNTSQALRGFVAPTPTPQPHKLTAARFPSLRCWIQKKCRMACPLFRGRWFSPMPFKKPITVRATVTLCSLTLTTRCGPQVAVGRPVRVPPPDPAWPGGNPPRELVQRVHAQYVVALQQLFDEAKKEIPGMEHRTLHIMQV